jgi:menaquinone-dependent protoporphyrinogen oxidase
MPNKSVSRRKFLKIAGLSLAGSVVACSGAGYLATLSPALNTPDIHYGKDPSMKQRILITYATRAGSTIEIASRIGQSLTERGYEVDVRPVKSKPALDGYQAVLLGSAVRIGAWLPEAVEFVKTNQADLRRLPVALFCVHMLNTGDDEASQTARRAYLDPVRALVNPAAEGYFAGMIEPSRLSLLDRLAVKVVKSPVGDFRDWDKVRTWSETVFA